MGQVHFRELALQHWRHVAGKRDAPWFRGGVDTPCGHGSIGSMGSMGSGQKRVEKMKFALDVVSQFRCSRGNLRTCEYMSRLESEALWGIHCDLTILRP